MEKSNYDRLTELTARIKNSTEEEREEISNEMEEISQKANLKSVERQLAIQNEKMANILGIHLR